MTPTRRDLLRLGAALPLAGPALARAADAPAGGDPRRGPLKTLDGYFPFDPPRTRTEWDARRAHLRQQVRVGLGLWPEPAKTPLNPVVHGLIDREGYTVEKVFFRSRPGVTVSGNLYRPKQDRPERRPAVLAAHGHWDGGRFHVAAEKAADAAVASGAEGDAVSARYFMQALPVSLARRGFVVFQYDMLGYADSRALDHRKTFVDAAAQLWLHSMMGLQTWNGVRSLDFLAGLPDVDPARIGVTGASGGGTQAFILAALDDRVAAACPAVMVSTAMQGGCVCENGSYLRVGSGNVELAGLFAPKPLALTGADDWTRELMAKGFPELQKLYGLLGAPENVTAKVWPEFPHNYNRPAREFMAGWFERHLMGREFSGPERPFEPVPPGDLSVYDAEHPRPADELPAAELAKLMQEEERERLRGLVPTDRLAMKRFEGFAGPLLNAAFGIDCGNSIVEEASRTAAVSGRGRTALTLRVVARRPGSAEVVPLTAEVRSLENVVLWLHPDGAASLRPDGPTGPAYDALRRAGATIIAPDLLGVGRAKFAAPRPVDPKYPAFTFGYNRPLIADRVRDATLAANWTRGVLRAKQLHAVGWGEFGVVTVLARSPLTAGRVAADAGRFRFEELTDANDPRMLPGALKAGGLPGFLALAAGLPTLLFNDADAESDTFAPQAYLAAGAPDVLVRSAKPVPPAEVAAWLLTGAVPPTLAEG